MVRGWGPPRHPRTNNFKPKNTMKNQTNVRKAGSAQAFTPYKSQYAIAGTKIFTHRYERRKIREQLRHLDWALPHTD